MNPSISRLHGVISFAGALLLSACGGDTDDLAATSPDPQTESSVSNPDMPCGGSPTCVNAGSVSLGHGEAFVQLHIDPERDDAITRWGNVLGDIIDCVDGGRNLNACVAASDSDDNCKAEFARLAATGGDNAAFDAVFLIEGGLCRPAEGQP